MGTRRAFQQQLKEMLSEETPVKEVSCMLPQGCVLAGHLFVPGALLLLLSNQELFFHRNHMLYTLDFRGSQHQATFNFS